MHLGFWDYVTFLCFFTIGVSFVVVLVLILGLPGKIAYARKHPDADAVNVMGWVGFVAIVPWIQAFIWAFKPTDIVDIRRTPAEEKEAIEEIMARHAGKALPEKPGGDQGARASKTETDKN